MDVSSDGRKIGAAPSKMGVVVSVELAVEVERAVAVEPVKLEVELGAAEGRVVVSPAIIEACRRGDRQAFKRLFEACRDRVYALAYHSTDDPAAAADVTQDVF